MISNPDDIWSLMESSIETISETQEERSSLEGRLQGIEDENKWSIARVRRMKRKVRAMLAECGESEMEDAIDCNAEDAA